MAKRGKSKGKGENRPEVIRRRRRARVVHRPPIGTPPGTLVSAPGAPRPRIHALAYGPDAIQEEIDADSADLAQLVGLHSVLWVDVVGLGDVETIHKVGQLFKLHPLALEDVLNVEQRPKVEDYEDHLFVVTRIVVPGDHFEAEQISLFVGSGFVVTFHERSGDCFEPVRERIRRGRGRIRASGPDYLAYALLDAVVDHYAPVVDRYGERLEELEDIVLRADGPHVVPALLDVRHDLQTLRRIAAPLRDKLAELQDEDLAVITPETRLHLRDCHDHAVRLLDAVEGWREFGANLMEVHLAISSQQLNAVMKVLTIIATIFIPLSFIAGVYGMNFNTDRSPFNMPELNWYFGYPFALAVMILVVAGQLLYFRRKGWLGRER